MPENATLDNLMCWKHTLWGGPDRPLHTHTFGEFYLCVDGTGYQRVSDARVSMKAGDLFYFPPGVPHFANCDKDQPSCGYVVYAPYEAFSPHHSGERETRRVLDLLARLSARSGGRLPLTASTIRDVMARLSEISHELRLGRPGHQIAAKAGLQSALLAMLRDPRIPQDLLEAFAAAQAASKLENVRTYLESHFQDVISIHQLVSMTRFGHSQFHMLFNKEFGCTCMQYLNSLRLNHAAKLIRETDDSVTDIAFSAGFPCLSHFYHLFRKQFGISPRRMRATARSAA